MKPLESKKEKEVREKRKKIWFCLIIILIMVASTAGFAIMNFEKAVREPSTTFDYNGHKFLKTESGWQTKIDNYVLNTRYLPSELENITSLALSLENFRDRKVYFVAKTQNERNAAQKLASVINDVTLLSQLACLPEDANDSFCLDNDLPLKNCDDASSENFIIILKETINESSLNYENNCVTAKGDSNFLTKAVEKIIFSLFIKNG